MKRSTKRIVLVLGLIAVIVFGGAGVYLALAWPGPVFSISIDTSGFAVTEYHNFTLAFPKSQLAVSLELSSSPLFFAITLFNSTDGTILSYSPPTSPGTNASAWVNAPPGAYRMRVMWTGELTVRIAVFARGFPFVA